MKRKMPVRRTDSFAWPTKQELYAYFEQAHNLDRATVDAEIEGVRPTFKLRKGRPINPQELWEKVGRKLEASLSR
ncbi:MAG: hypothetical protein GF344_18540 [Chitinivibrionales bacterium]|nr:hypothetical protein [Chitinivibrionales bacterium]MBD3358647.1 hypothetical protein [Chitinivibrionales bacterium]